MRQQIKPTVERLFLGPLRDLVDTTFDLTTRPASVAREFAEENGHQFARAVTYFVATFSAAVILSKITYAALGIETVKEVPYWTLHVGVFLCIVILAAILAFPLRPGPTSLFVKAACLAYGACFLICSFLLAVASLTLVGLRQVGYIPDFNVDMTSVRNYVLIGEQAFRECLREQSIIFDATQNGFGGAFKALRYPLDKLTYVQPIFFFVAPVLFAVLTFFGAERRRWAAGLAAGLSGTAVVVGLAIGEFLWAHYLWATTPCPSHAIVSAERATAEEQLRRLEELYSGRVGQEQEYGKVLTGVERTKDSLILRMHISKRAMDPEGFAKWIAGFRKVSIRDFCSAKRWAAHYRIAGISRVWIFRYGDTELEETVVESANQCRR